MTKFELIEAIRELNATATVEFLSQFEAHELQEYLEHLLEVDVDVLTAAAPVVPFN